MEFNPVVCTENRKDIEEIKADMEKIDKAIDGNGSEGLKTRVIRIEEQVKTIFNQNKSIMKMAKSNMAALGIAVIAFIIKSLLNGGS